jgi:hypothetical protein
MVHRSTEPQRVEVLDSGTLALSSGPVRDPQGKRIGTFNSVWRREPRGAWKVVFDNGERGPASVHLPRSRERLDRAAKSRLPLRRGFIRIRGPVLGRLR